jgi:hypothetical protein
MQAHPGSSEGAAIMSEWRSIDSAPKGQDFITILLYSDNGITTGYHHSRYGWVSHNLVMGGENFTHWMPLPDPPKGKARDISRDK